MNISDIKVDIRVEWITDAILAVFVDGKLANILAIVE